MIPRKYLQHSVLVSGQSDGRAFERTFTIVRKMEGEGASSVCYEAYHEGSGRGVLKEFYPRNLYTLDRDPQGQLIHSTEFEEEHLNFLRAEQEYLEPCQRLLELKQSGEYPELAGFLPNFEIYHGCDRRGNRIGTAYIWTPDPEVETFERLCAEIRKHPRQQPEHKLVTVLLAVNSLTECVCQLHRAGLLHRDLNPSNFGFRRRGGETMTQMLSLFDVNSICSAYADQVDTVWTEGYQEPESGLEFPTNQTDIYSIGAILFHGLAISGSFRPGEDGLRELVDGSELIRASEANSHPRLRAILTTILEKCLCERTYRYECCEDLLEDLKAALFYALPSEFARKNAYGQRWVLADMDAFLDVNREKNSQLAMRCHLFAHPLYEHEAEGRLSVLILGFGSYGQKYLDAVVQAGQLPHTRLTVTAVSKDWEDRSIYLDARPGLGEFFRLDGPFETPEEPWGSLFFEEAELDPEARELPEALLRSRPGAIFVALGGDELNRRMAAACRAAARRLGLSCSVSYVLESEPGEEPPETVALWVNRDVRSSKLDPEIERMAFNTHLLWEKNLNPDCRAVRREFRKPYNHDSCVSGVLSLKYKLHSLGIPTEDFRQAARSFRQKLSAPGGEELWNLLVWAEHRRWVSEKLCLGWTRLRNLEECAGGMTKDPRTRRHICIVSSRPEPGLARRFPDCSCWDTAPDRELQQLDELDRLSVELHRMYVKKAGERERKQLLSGSSMASVRSLIRGSRRTTAAFLEWLACLRNLQNRDLRAAGRYPGLKAQFLAEAGKELTKEKKQALDSHVRGFETLFYPILASAEYRDWKQVDGDMIEGIPFILTYEANGTLVVPLQTEELLGNVAAAAAAGPSTVLYLALVRKREQLGPLRRMLDRIGSFMERKGLKASAELLLLYAPELEGQLGDGWKSLGCGRLRRVRQLPVAGEEEAAARTAEILKKKARGRRLFALEQNETELSRLLQRQGVSARFPGYRFDTAAMKFENLGDCEALTYLGRGPGLTAADLGFAQEEASPEFYSDYGRLWEVYTGHTEAWRGLCSLLGQYAGEHDPLVTLDRSSGPEEPSVRCTYVLPAACMDTARRILEFLQLSGDCCACASDACRVTLWAPWREREAYDRLFSRSSALMQPEAVQLQSSGNGRRAAVIFDSLEVENLTLPPEMAGEMRQLLEFFRDMGYLLNLRENPVRFTYGTRKIKDLLTHGDRLPEIFLYHSARDTGYFDDVRWSSEIGGPLQGRGCVVTRGLRSLAVVCTSRPEDWAGLADWTRSLGFRTVPVLAVDPPQAEKQIPGLILLQGRERFREIGGALREILENPGEREEESPCTDQTRLTQPM